jgi:hypothetical protein
MYLYFLTYSSTSWRQPSMSICHNLVEELPIYIRKRGYTFTVHSKNQNERKRSCSNSLFLKKLAYQFMYIYWNIDQ